MARCNLRLDENSPDNLVPSSICNHIPTELSSLDFVTGTNSNKALLAMFVNLMRLVESNILLWYLLNGEKKIKTSVIFV